MTKHLERIMWKGYNLLFLANIRYAELRNEAEQKAKRIRDASHESDTERSPFKPNTRQELAPAVNPFIYNPSITPKLENAMQKMVEEEAKGFFAEHTDPSIQKAADKVLSDIFFAEFVEVTPHSKTNLNTFSRVYLHKSHQKVFRTTCTTASSNVDTVSFVDGRFFSTRSNRSTLRASG